MRKICYLIQEWPYFEDEMFGEEGEHNEHSDSDFEYEDYGSKKKKGKAKGGSKSKGVSSLRTTLFPFILYLIHSANHN